MLIHQYIVVLIQRQISDPSIEKRRKMISTRRLVAVETILGYSFAQTVFKENLLGDFSYKNTLGKKAGTLLAQI